MIVPFNNRQSKPSEAQPSPDPVFFAMAAATMHQMGRLFETAGDDNVHTIERGPEYNKWDEALQEHGRIRNPKELDEPQKWLNQEQFKPLLDRIDREDRPDGSVILSKKVPTS